MEHMKKFLMILVAVVAAGAAFMYVRNMMMARKGDNVKIQQYESKQTETQQTQRVYRSGADVPG